LALLKEPDDPEFSEVDFGDNTLNSFDFAELIEAFTGLLMFTERFCIHLSIACENFL